MYTNILEIKHLKKSYGQIKAVNDISFEVRKGSLFAFLGQNGAGKSTTINVITTLLNKDEGEVLINGYSDENYIRTKIGVVFQENVSDDLLTVKENLISRGVLYLKEKQAVENRYQEIIETLELKDLENRKYKTLSGGQKRRVEIARALFSDPEILILDEPTTGLDPETRQLVWQVLEKLQKEKNITIFLTTHYMEEAAKADYVVIIHKGKIIAKGSPSELKNTYSKDYFKIVPKDKQKLTTYLEKEKKIYKKVSDQYLIEVENAQETIELILELKENIKTFEVVKGTLDDVFIHVIGEQNV
ncbi:MAG: ABC transporter ATP-binding protein [Candidatus Phytoplasma sp.]|nr:ABC transporter ATP-binding protein [Phytoplasma sp.]